MDLIFWRHADAEDGAPDLARRLTPKGHAQAARVAAWLLRHLPDDAAILVSPAVRAQQTAQALQRPCKTLPALAPGAGVKAILDAAGNKGAVVVVVGHQPDLGRVIAYLASGQDREWEVEKGALWWLGGSRVLRTVISPDLL